MKIFYLRKFIYLCFFLNNLYSQDNSSLSSTVANNYSGYQLSKDCLSCLNSEDFIKKGQTFAQQEKFCLEEELSRFQIRFDITLNIIVSGIDLYSKRKDIPQDQKQGLQDKIKYLQKSSVLFVDFIKKFCEENSAHLYGSRYARFAYYSQLMDLLNIHLHHLELFFSYFNSDDDTFNILFTNLIDDILEKSKNNEKLTFLENQKIDIFLRLSNFFKSPNFDFKHRTLFLKKLKYLYVHDNNSIADALHKKFNDLARIN